MAIEIGKMGAGGGGGRGGGGRIGLLWAVKRRAAEDNGEVCVLRNLRRLFAGQGDFGDSGSGEVTGVAFLLALSSNSEANMGFKVCRSVQIDSLAFCMENEEKVLICISQ